MADSDVIAHYGVRGMKWGVRRTPEQLGHKPKSKSSSSKSVAKKKVQSKQTDISKLSDQQLRDRINRLQMEKTFRELSASSSAKKGNSFTKRMLKQMSDEFLKEASKQGSKYAVELLMKELKKRSSK